MHEWGYCESILDAVRRRAAGRRVKCIKLQVGVLHQLNQEALQQAFSLTANGSETENAILDLVFIPTRWRCYRCQYEGEATDSLVVCCNCGGTEIEVSGGDELILESIEYETAS